MFKKLIQATVAASLVASPMIAASAQAQVHRETVTTVKQRPNGTVVKKTVVRRDDRTNRREWRQGQRFDRRYATNYRVVDYRTYRGRGLYAPPRGHRWVRSGNDAILIADRNGTIRAVVRGAIR